MERRVAKRVGDGEHVGTQLAHMVRIDRFGHGSI